MGAPVTTRIRRALRALFGPARSVGRAIYKGAENNRLILDWITKLLSPDRENAQDANTLVARSRDLAKNNGVASFWLILLQINVLGTQGYKHQARTRRANGELDAETNSIIEAAWKAWCESKLTIDGRSNFFAVLRLVLTAAARDGEIFIRKLVGIPGTPHGCALQLIDRDLVDHTYNRAANPSRGEREIRCGVEVDTLGRRVGYWVFSDYAARDGYEITARPRYFVPADEMIHLYDPERPSQTRGIPWMHAAMMAMRLIDGYAETEAFAARVSAGKMGWFVTKDDKVFGEESGDEGDAGSAETVDPNTGESTPRALRMDATPGTFTQLPKGVTFEGWDPQHPTSQYPDFIKSGLRMIATGLASAYNTLANDLEGVSFSAMRSGMVTEKDVYKLRQKWLLDEFVLDVYAWWMSVASLTGDLALPTRDWRRYTDARWSPRGWPPIDPLKDVLYYEKAIALGVLSRTKIHAAQGTDFEENLEELADEKKLAAEAGINIEGLTGDTLAALLATDPNRSDGDRALGRMLLQTASRAESRAAAAATSD